MKRKISDVNEEESKLSKLLFKKTENLVERLNNDAYEEEDLDKKPAWVDDDDEQFSANIIPDVKSKGLYTEKLKQKYETLMGTPNWAKLTKKVKAEDDEDDSEILRTVGHIKNNKSNLLQKGVLGIKNFPKINKSTGTEGKIITSVEFHPKMSVSMVSGTSGIVSLFSIGGDINNKLHSFRIKYKGRGTQTSRAHFTSDGNKAYVASKYTHDFCEYDLVKAEPKLVALPPVIKSAQIFELSPDGKYFAISDGQDELYITSTISKELLRTLKHNSNVISAVFGSEGDKLFCYCEGGEVTIWDLSTYRSLKKFYDNGCVTASSINISPCGRLLATGSGEGIVNIYEAESLTTTEPLPFKTISNLTTKITDLKFNATTEILSVSSSFFPNAIKLIHIPSYHVYMNFPKSELNQIECMNFSPNSGYMALGNNKSSAYLYRLTHYKNY